MTIKECLAYFLKNCKSQINTLMVNFSTLKAVLDDSSESTGDVFSPALRTHLKCMKLCAVGDDKAGLRSVVNFLLENLKLEGVTISGTSAAIGSHASYFVHTCLSKQYGISNLQVDRDSGFSLKKFEYKAKDVVLEVAHSSEAGIWKQIVIAEEAMFT